MLCQKCLNLFEKRYHFFICMYFAMSITFHNIEVWFTETTTVDSEIKRSLKSGGIWENMAKMFSIWY